MEAQREPQRAIVHSWWRRAASSAKSMDKGLLGAPLSWGICIHGDSALRETRWSFASNSNGTEFRSSFTHAFARRALQRAQQVVDHPSLARLDLSRHIHSGAQRNALAVNVDRRALQRERCGGISIPSSRRLPRLRKRSRRGHARSRYLVNGNVSSFTATNCPAFTKPMSLLSTITSAVTCVSFGTITIST